MDVAFFSIIISILALLFAGYLALRISRKDAGTPKMMEISSAIQKGAMTFLNREYKTLVFFVVVVVVVIAVTLENGSKIASAFVVGAFCSALAGNIGMRIATSSNARTANAVKNSLEEGLSVAFSGGMTMSMCVVGLGVLGVTVLYLIFKDPQIIFGFGFGASSIALFARVGGGIYTKGADIGADLVGKVEAGIPEDDPRNPAVIADNVGDNVGDVAGMGADLFESYVDSIIATMALGVVAFAVGGVTLPLAIASLGIISAIVGSFFVKGKGLHTMLNRGIFVSAIIVALGSFFLVRYILGVDNVGVFYAILAGLLAGIVIGLITEYYTSYKNSPTRSVSEASQTGAATTIIYGLSVGMFSTFVPIVAVSTAIWIAYHFAGMYGIAIAAVGMLSTLGITLAADTYGPIADNAAGIAEMANMGEKARKRAEELDAVGNTTAAIGKGFAIGSAALTALALFSAYVYTVGIEVINIINPRVMIGLFIGGMLPFLFSSFTMRSVGKTASQMVNEVRRQFKEIPGIMSGKAKADYARCIDISTTIAIKEMTIPGLLAVLTPIVVGLLLGKEAVGGLLGGSIVTGFLLAITMANAGAAWDNAKKYIEAGHFGGKGTETHAASVIGDMVGDPFKDTAGPSLNILIKLVSIVALIFAPLF